MQVDFWNWPKKVWVPTHGFAQLNAQIAKNAHLATRSHVTLKQSAKDLFKSFTSGQEYF